MADTIAGSYGYLPCLQQEAQSQKERVKEVLTMKTPAYMKIYLRKEHKTDDCIHVNFGKVRSRATLYKIQEKHWWGLVLVKVPLSQDSTGPR